MSDSDRDAASDPRHDPVARLIIRNVEEMAFPATQAEAVAFAEVLQLPRVRVTRAPRNDLLRMGMVPYDCHRNCAEFAASDFDGLTHHVSGWIIFNSDLILHSVVEREGLWRCLTPQLIEVPDHFPFIPDPHIRWVNTDDTSREAYRGDMKLSKALRRYPEIHIRMRNRFVELVSLGMSPADARAAVERTMGQGVLSPGGD